MKKITDKKFDVTALGELLIDFTSSGLGAQSNPLFEANPGGAPCNVLSMLSRLGKKTAFIGRVGDDIFGRILEGTLNECNISTDGLSFDRNVRTTLAFIKTSDGGEREFSFYRAPGADMMLSVDDIDTDIIKNSRIFHFGTLSSTHKTCREATRFALDVAKDNGVTVSFDPNLRESLWDSLEDAKAEIEYGLSRCDILKISDNELEFLVGHSDYDRGIDILREKYGIPLIFLTLGKNGSRAYCSDVKAEAPTFNNITPIEKTGAGDTFMGCALNFILEKGGYDLKSDELTSLLRFANAGASIITTRYGALRVMPTEEEILALLKSEQL